MNFLKKTIGLAENGVGKVKTNPLVGCIIVKDSKIVGRGYHKEFGGDHAEIMALEQAGSLAEQADLYVNLEPCSHAGKTPPCTRSIIKAGIKKVIIYMLDPNPLVKGVDDLRKNGVEVEIQDSDEAKLFNERYLKNIKTGLPFIAIKCAVTMDGKIATVSGESKWITKEDSRIHVHKMRNKYDAVLVGTNTIIKDNPSLNCRIVGGRDPLRIIIDRQNRIPKNFQIFRDNNFIYFDYNVNFKIMFRELYNKGISSVLVEGGAELNSTLLNLKLVDKIYYFIAPKIMGLGKNAFADLGIKKLNQALNLKNITVIRFKEDILIQGYL